MGYDFSMNFKQLQRLFGDSDADIARGLVTSRQLVRHWRLRGITDARAAWIREVLRRRKRA
jgi:hypothetical protein